MMSPKARTERISLAEFALKGYLMQTKLSESIRYTDVYWEPGPSCWLQCSVASWVFLVLLWDTLPCLKHEDAVLSFDRYCILCSIQ